MSVETEELAIMLTAALSGVSIPEEKLVKTGQDVAVLGVLLDSVFNHLPYLRGFVGIDDHRVKRCWGGRVHEVELNVPLQGRDECSDLGKTVQVAGPIGTNLSTSREQLGTAAYIFLCANRRLVLVVEGQSVTDYRSITELLTVLDSWAEGDTKHLWAGRYRTPKQNRTAHADLSFELILSLALEVLRGLQEVINKSNELRDKGTRHGRGLAASIGATLERIRT